jgi:hypothetical protein
MYPTYPTYPTYPSLVSICFAASLWEVHKVVCSLSTAGCIEDLEDRIQSVRLANAPPEMERFGKTWIRRDLERLADPDLKISRNGKLSQKSRNILEYTALFTRISWTSSAIFIFRYFFHLPFPLTRTVGETFVTYSSVSSSDSQGWGRPSAVTSTFNAGRLYPISETQRFV